MIDDLLTELVYLLFLDMEEEEHVRFALEKAFIRGKMSEVS